jgi:hypothetical protein
VRYYLTLLVLYICNTLVYGQGISISPSRIFFNGEPGQTVSQVITFSNTSNAELNFVANLKDWDRDSIGVKKYCGLAYAIRKYCAPGSGGDQIGESFHDDPQKPSSTAAKQHHAFFYTSERTKSRTPKWP